MNLLLGKLKTLFTKGFKSKSVWLGYIVVALTTLQEVLSQFQVVIPAHTYTIAGAVIGSLIIVVRMLTSTSLEDK
jgi:hypothetical protein